MKTKSLIHIVSLIYYNVILIQTPPFIDLWWHLQVGKDIIKGQWPSPDLYSFSGNSEWVIHSWLADVLFYFLYLFSSQFIGDHTLFFFDVIRHIILSVFLIQIFNHIQIDKLDKSSCIFITTIIGALTWQYTPRPYLFTPLLFIILFKLIFPLKNILKYNIIIFLLYLIWVNTHGGFIIFLFLYSVILIYRYLVNTTHYIDAHCYIFAALILITFINPNPVNLLARIIEAGNYPSNDWKSLLWWLKHDQTKVFLLLFIYAATFISWVYYLIKKSQIQNINEYSILCTLSFVLSFMHIRFCWMLVFPIIQILNNINPSFLSKLYVRCILNIISIATFILINAPSNSGFNRLPYESVEFIIRENINNNVFSPWTWSGFITWKTNARIKIFVDTRIEPFSKKDILFSQLAYTYPLFSLYDIMKTNADYILSPVDENIIQWNSLMQNGFISYELQCDHNLLAKIEKEKVLIFYEMFLDEITNQPQIPKAHIVSIGDNSG